MDQANATRRWTGSTAAVADRFARCLDRVSFAVDGYRHRAVARANDDLEPADALSRMGAPGLGDLCNQSQNREHHKKAAENLAQVRKACVHLVWASSGHSIFPILRRFQITLF